MQDQVHQPSLDHRIDHLQSRIIRLQKTSNQVSWVRAGVMATGIGTALAIGYSFGAEFGWLVFGLTCLLFSIVVYFHRRIEHWLQIFTLSRDLYSDQRARLNLDWDKLHPPAPPPLGAESLALDLDLTGEHSLHRLLDTTVTETGSEYLASWLTLSSTLLTQTLLRQTLVRELLTLTRFRLRFRLTFRQFDKAPFAGEGLAAWLSASTRSNQWKRILPIVSMLALLNLVLFTLYIEQVLPPFWSLTLLIYLAVNVSKMGDLAKVMQGLLRAQAELDQLEPLFQLIECAPYDGREGLRRLCAPFLDTADAPSSQIRRIKRLTFAVGLRSNMALGLLLNLVVPWDFFLAYFAERLSHPLTRAFPGWLKIVYQLDALIALADYAYWNPHLQFPDLSQDADPVFQVENLGHPLILNRNKVRNSFVISRLGELDIITGSNMAGKSTFIKTIGINLCLAFAGAPVDASSFRSIPFRLHTCIHITDSVTDGFSYFYAEVQCLRGLMDKLESGIVPLLYLVDEIFRGTNNRERLAGASAYIQAALGKPGVGVLSTHDLELAHQFEGNSQVENYHFKDSVSDGQLVFDYRIHRGICPTTNALRIMRMAGLPTGPMGA